MCAHLVNDWGGGLFLCGYIYLPIMNIHKIFHIQGWWALCSWLCLYMMNIYKISHIQN